MGLSQALIQALVVSNLKQHRHAGNASPGTSTRFEVAVRATATRRGISVTRVWQAVDDLTPSAPYEDQEIVLTLVETLNQLMTDTSRQGPR